MNLIIDAGNTHIKWAIYNNGEQIHKSVGINWDMLSDSGFLSKSKGIKSIIVSSVREIPADVLSSLSEITEDYHLLHHSLPLPVVLKYSSPETLGIDRIAAVVGGSALFPGQPVLIIDLGTAITFDFLSPNSEFLGGNISPGLSMRFKALEKYTDHLPHVKAQAKTPFLGGSTIEAIRSGVQKGIEYEIDAYINALINKYNGLKTILTGGDASFFVKNLKNTIFVVPDLVLDGLNIILEYQKLNNQD